jgi:Ca2+-binding RTX toxin-like protein
MVGAVDMFNNSDLALAAYSDLTQGVPTNQQIDALKQSGDGMSQAQAERFAVRYPAVLSVANCPESGFQATVFKSSDGQLAVAFRGTKDFFTDVIDADKQIFTNGAAYNQIVDMYNWWKCVTTQRGDYVQQYEIQPIVVGAMPPSNGVLLFSQDAVDPDMSDAALDFYLVPKVAAMATGELVGQADLSAVSVTGHSLGGHLASAFTALFNGQVENTYTYNGPGFIETPTNQMFFAALEGVATNNVVMPSGVAGKVIRVQANNALPGENQLEFISDLHGGTPGTLVQVAVEDKGIGAGNHSIVNLTDSLALFNLLGALDSSLSVETFNSIFHAASNENGATRESLLGSIQSLFGVNANPLPVGDEDAQRNEFYKAINNLAGVDTYTALLNNADINSSFAISAQQAATDFGAFLALHTLAPLYISGAALQEPNQSLYNQWASGEFSAQYLEDRAAMLGALLGANSVDMDYSAVSGAHFKDKETAIALGDSGGGLFSADNKQILFGAESSDTLTGGNGSDHLYGAGGSDYLSGGAGSDYLEGGAGDDGLNAGTGFDRINGGMGNDAYLIDSNFGDVMIADDLDGGSISLLSGITFRRVGDGEANTDGLYIAVDENGEWLNGKEGWSVSVSGSTATVSVKDDQNNVHVIAIDDFNIVSNQFGIQFEEMIDIEIPSLGGAFTVPNRGFLGAYTPQGADNPVDVFLPNNRHVENNDPSIPEALNVEQYRNKSLVYSAVDYWGEWNADDLHWEPIDKNGPPSPYPNHPYETLAIDTSESRHGKEIMRFEGSNQNDALYGNDWTSQMQAIKDWDDANDHYYRLNRINGFDPAKHGNNDVLFGLNGDDLIIGDGNQSVLEQQAGSQKGNRDILVGGRGSDVVYGMGGNDILLGMEQYRSGWGAASLGLTYNPNKYASLAEAIFNNAFLYDPETQQETQTALTLEDKDEKNYLNGGDGNDVLEGASFSDVIDGGHGYDWIYAGAGCDVVAGGAGNDEISGDSYAYFYQGMAYSDFIAPDELPEANDYRRGHFYQKSSDGVALRYDFDKDSDYNDVLDGGAGNDLVQGEIGADIVGGGAGNDVLFGDRVFGAGFFVDGLPPANFQSLAKQFHGNDVVDGGDGDDLIVGGGGADRVLGGNGNDTVYGDVGLDAIEKGVNTADAPSIVASDEGWWGNDVLFGGAGNDALIGEGGDDVLDGGAGDDFLYGDWANWQSQAYADPAAKTGNDTLYGGAGNDQLMGNGGDDALEGGSGNDKLYGDNPEDSSVVSLGDDVLDGGAGDDYLYAGAGNDTLTGGSGDDYLGGGAGDDTYIFSAGSGVDTLEDAEGATTLRLAVAPIKTVLAGDSETVIYLSADGSHRIHLATGTAQNIARIYVGDESHQLELSVADHNAWGIGHMQGNQTYTLSSTYAGSAVLYDAMGENDLVFDQAWQSDDGYLDVQLWGGDGYRFAKADNPSAFVDFALSAEAVAAVSEVTDADGAAVNVRLATKSLASDVANTLYGFGGNDLIHGFGGDDTIYGGAGDDTLDGGDGADRLFGGDGNDVLRGGAGHQDFLYGDAGDDIFYLNSGEDVAFGGEGDDTFIAEANSYAYAKGEAGADTFIVNSSNNSFFQITDQRFDAGDEIQLDFNADRLHLTDKSVGVIAEDGVTVKPLLSWMLHTQPEDYWQSVEKLTLRFADGSTWSIDEIKTRLQTATALDDVLIGETRDDVLRGLEGNDTLYGIDGNDVLYGNAGYDILVGGAGNDVFHLGLGDEADIVREANTERWSTDADTVWLEASIASGQVSLSVQNDDDLLIAAQDGSASITLEDFFDSSVSQRRNLSLSFDGENNFAWDSEFIQKSLFKSAAPSVQVGVPTAAANTLSGGSSSEYLYGDAGNDILKGNGGSDWLDGGSGNDTLTGGSGIDTYRFGVGSGNDVITDSASSVASDRVRLDFTVAMSDLRLKLVNGSDQLVISRRDAAGAVTDSIQVNRALGRLIDVRGNDLRLEENGDTLLNIVRNQLATQTITLTYNESDSRFVALNASDLLGGTLSDTEKARWQIVSAAQTSGNFLPDQFDVDGDGNTTSDQTFLFVENLWNSGTNYVGFMPNTSAGNASFTYTLQRDDGLQIEASMQVLVQENTGSLVGTDKAEVLDGGQSATALIINAGGGDDRVFDGYGDDTVYGGDGNDRLTFGNWADNGNDIFDGGAGNDVLDAGWGSDTLIGGAGNDLYIEGNLWSGDRTTIDNSGGAESDVDTLQIGLQGYGVWDYRALWFTREGNDLLLDQLDELADGEIRIKDWYAATDTNGDGALNDAGAGRLDIFVAQQDDGAVLQADGNSGNFDALINAMAQFGTKPASVADAANALQEEYQAAWMQLAVPAAA